MDVRKKSHIPIRVRKLAQRNLSVSHRSDCPNVTSQPYLPPLTRLRRYYKIRDNLNHKMESVIVQNGESSAIEAVKQKSESVTNGESGKENGERQKNGTEEMNEEAVEVKSKKTPNEYTNGDKKDPEPELIDLELTEDIIVELEPDKKKDSLRRSKRQTPEKSKPEKSPKKPKNQTPEKKESTPVPETPKVAEETTPESVRTERYLSGKLSGRRPLRGLLTPHPATKRKADFEGDSPEEKKARETPSMGSPGWRYYASPSALFWKCKESLTPSRARVVSPNDSMEVNVDDLTAVNKTLDDSQFEAELHEVPKPLWKVCNIM